jgi:hypothetical protein
MRNRRGLRSTREQYGGYQQLLQKDGRIILPAQQPDDALPELGFTRHFRFEIGNQTGTSYA